VIVRLYPGVDGLKCGAGHIPFPVLQSWETYDRTINWIRDAGLPPADLEQSLERTTGS